jgi:zinc protease
MAVVAVGDFDGNKIERLIKENFGWIKSPELLRVRENFTVPENKEPLFAIASDKEATNSVVSIYNKRDAKPVTNIEEYKEDLITSLFSGMLNIDSRNSRDYGSSIHSGQRRKHKFSEDS